MIPARSSLMSLSFSFLLGLQQKKLYRICLPYFMSTSYADIFLLGIQLTISNLRLGSLTLIPRRLNSSKAVEIIQQNERGGYQWDRYIWKISLLSCLPLYKRKIKEIFGCFRVHNDHLMAKTISWWMSGAHWAVTRWYVFIWVPYHLTTPPPRQGEQD